MKPTLTGPWAGERSDNPSSPIRTRHGTIGPSLPTLLSISLLLIRGFRTTGRAQHNLGGAPAGGAPLLDSRQSIERCLVQRYTLSTLIGDGPEHRYRERRSPL